LHILLVFNCYGVPWLYLAVLLLEKHTCWIYWRNIIDWCTCRIL